MKTRTFALLAFLCVNAFLAVFWVPSAYGWWVTDGAAICSGMEGINYRKTISDGNGGIIMAWSDSRSGSERIYAQRVDLGGNILWESNGVPICTTGTFTGYLSLTLTGYGSAVVAWKDSRGGIYAQRIDAMGNCQWTVGGRQVAAEVDPVVPVGIISDCNGGAILAYGSQCFTSGCAHFAWAAIKRIDANGDMIWKREILDVHEDPDTEYLYRVHQLISIASDSAGGAFVNFHEASSYRPIEYPGWPWTEVASEYLRKYDSDGQHQWYRQLLYTQSDSTLWQGGLVSTSPGVAHVEIKKEGALYPYQIVKINMSGEEWRVSLCETEQGSEARFDSDGLMGIVATYYLNGSLYAQRFDQDGNRLWAANGIFICPASKVPTGNDIQSDGDGGAIIVWSDGRNGEKDIFGQRVSSGGIPQLVADGVGICTATGDQEYPALVTDNLMGAIIVWNDYREDPMGIYANGTDRMYLGPICQVEPDTLDIGTVALGQSKEGEFIITNVGGGNLVCDVSEHCGEFEIIAPPAGPFGLKGGESALVKVRFTPIASGTATCLIETGTFQCADVLCSGVGTTGPATCSVAPISIDYDTVTVGGYKDETFTITNLGGGTLEGSVSASCDQFSIVSGLGPYSLAVGQSKDITVRFAPTIGGEHACIVSTGSYCYDVMLSGTGKETFPSRFVGTEIVDGAGVNAGKFSSLVLDAAGNPHISYLDVYTPPFGGALRYAVKTGGSWVIETADSSGDGGSHSSLDLDARGNPHISYRQGSDVKYVRKSGGVWLTPEVVYNAISTNTADAANTSLALDADGNPHICYYDFDGQVLRYASKAGGSWINETVDSAAVNGVYASLALDRQGTPHISYQGNCGGGDGDLKYAVKIGGSWIRDIADATGETGRFTSLALDRQGRAHISYCSYPNSDLMYIVKSPTGWEDPEVVDAPGTVGYYTSLALDADDTPHISYYDNTNKDLKYAVKRWGYWVIETLDLTGDVGKHTSLALDFHGNPHVSYYDNTNQDLRYANAAVHLTSPVGGERWSAGGQETVTWEGAGEIDILLSQNGGASYVTLLSSVSGGMAAVNVPGWTTDLARVKIVRADPYSTSESPGVFSIDLEKRYPWWTTRVDTAGDVGAWASLALGPEGNPHISYADGPPNNDLKYAVKVGNAWLTEMVDGTGVTTGTRTSLALDGQGATHISYFGSAGTLRYATNASGTWVKQTLDSGVSIGLFTSLALDAQGNPHIGYYDGLNTQVKYVTKVGGSWSTPVVVDGLARNAGAYVSIAVDARGIPHMSYHVTDGGGVLGYATKVGGSWVPENVAGGNVGSFTSIAVDSRGNPCISYLDGTSGYVKYAVKSGGVWVFETVDTERWVGFWTSLALDAKDVPHISYQNYYNDDLKYAVKVGDAWSTAIIDNNGNVGEYTSLALDAQGNPHIAYYDVTNHDLKYISAAIEVAEPSPGVTWPVGGSRAVTWNGAGVIDVWLSVDGGAGYDLVAGGVSNGSYMLTVPHTPSRFCKVKLERTVGANTFGTYYYPHSISVSDSFFTIETSVELLSMMVAPAKEGEGNLITWSTEPGPEDLEGYRLEKKRGSEEWFALVSRTKETSCLDVEGVSGDRYRLFAINGLGGEFYLGEASDGNMPPFSAALALWPAPFRSGELNIAYPAGGPLGVAAIAEVAVYDVAGRRVKTLVRGMYPAGMQRVKWDGRDEHGNLVTSGLYFVRLINEGMAPQVRKLVIVR